MSKKKKGSSTRTANIPPMRRITPSTEEFNFVPSPKQVPRIALSIRETAISLGTSEKTIANWIDSGKLRAAKVVGRVLVPMDAIDELLKDNVCGLKSSVADLVETEKRKSEVLEELARIEIQNEQT